jgi:hypothetical protein
VAAQTALGSGHTDNCGVFDDVLEYQVRPNADRRLGFWRSDEALDFMAGLASFYNIPFYHEPCTEVGAGGRTKRRRYLGREYADRAFYGAGRRT